MTAESTSETSTGTAGPGRLMKGINASILFIAYIPGQLLFMVPAVLFMVFQDPNITMEEAASSDTFLLFSIIATGMAAALTITIAWAWPKVLRRAGIPAFSGSEWLGWVKPTRIPLWLVPLVTIPMMLFISGGVTALSNMVDIGDAEVSIQLEMFRTPAMQIVTTIVVSTVVPLAEELIFRGAVYGALVRRDDGTRTRWQRHRLAFIITALAFGLVHVPAGFTSAAAILAIVLLSVFLTLLRYLSGSVKPSVVAHTTWNLMSAIGMVVAANMPDVL